MLSHFLLLFSPLLVIASASSKTTRAPCTHEYCDKQNDLFEWVEANGGYINPKVEMTTGPDPSGEIRGFFATAPISIDETIFNMPFNMFPCRANMCELVAALGHELSLGQTSFFWPYLAVMEDYKIDLPYVWTDEERDLLTGLYPHYLATSTAHDECDKIDMNDEINLRALQIVMTHATDIEEDKWCLLVMYDFINYGGDQNDNSKIGMVVSNVSLQTKASVDIKEKQQLFTWYGDESETTVHRFFHNLGFFAPYPRMWVFEDSKSRQVSFKMFEDDGGYDFDFNPFDEHYQNNMAYMYREISIHLSTVLATQPKGLVQYRTAVSPRRYATALAYRAECVNALKMALEHLLRFNEEEEEEVEEEEDEEKEDEEEVEKDEKEDL